MSRCVQISWMIHRIRGGWGSVKLNVYVVLCVINCQEEPLAAEGQSSAVVAGPVSQSLLFTPWLRFGSQRLFLTVDNTQAQTIPTRQFASSATTGMGENSPTSYTLQGFSLKTWVNFHPQHIPRQICIFLILFFLIILKLCVSQTYTIFSKHKGKKVVDKVMKFPFHS